MLEDKVSILEIEKRILVNRCVTRTANAQLIDWYSQQEDTDNLLFTELSQTHLNSIQNNTNVKVLTGLGTRQLYPGHPRLELFFWH